MTIQPCWRVWCDWCGSQLVFSANEFTVDIPESWRTMHYGFDKPYRHYCCQECYDLDVERIESGIGVR